MDIGAQGIVDTIASSSTQYLASYSPIFLLIGGLVLAFGVISVLIGFFGGNIADIDGIDLDDTMHV